MTFEQIVGYVIYLLEALGLLTILQGLIVFAVALAMVKRLLDN